MSDDDKELSWDDLNKLVEGMEIGRVGLFFSQPSTMPLESGILHMDGRGYTFKAIRAKLLYGSTL